MPLNRSARRLLKLEPVEAWDIDPADWNLREHGITQSLLSCFMQCPKMGLFAAQGWNSKAMWDKCRYGTICHHINDKLYSSPDMHDAGCRLDVIDRALTEIEEKLIADGDPGGQRIQDDLARAEAVMQQYCHAYPGDFNGKVFIGAEMRFRTDFAGFKLIGKVDGLYKDKNGGIWLMETKTKSQVPGNLMQLMARDLQNQFYLTMYEMKTGKRVEGVLYNIIRKPGSNPRQGETLLAYKNRIYNEVDSNRPHYFKRLELYYTDEDREIFRAELIDKLAEVEGILSGKRSVYHRETSCTGNYGCDFMEMCITGKTGTCYQSKLFTELAA
jgi:RecB family exonuclease